VPPCAWETRKCTRGDSGNKRPAEVNTAVRMRSPFLRHPQGGGPANLRWEDVDFASGHVTLCRQTNRETYHVAMKETFHDLLRGMPSRLKNEWVFPSATNVAPIDPRNWLREVFRPGLGSVMSIVSSPISSWTVRRSVPRMTRREAKVWRRSCQRRPVIFAFTMSVAVSLRASFKRRTALRRCDGKTCADAAKEAVGASAEVVQLPREISAPGGIRTPNPQIRRTFQDDEGTPQ
jgi:hypothetical protein